MNSSKFEKNICRICLEHKVLLNWNDEILEVSGVRYKDCYYKYTKLEEIDPDPYPTSLCDKCAEELGNAYILFEKALESFHILQKLYKKYPDQDEDDIAKTDYKLIQTEDSFCLLTSRGNESNRKSSNGSCKTNKLIVKEDIVAEPTYFIDIQNFNASHETPLEEQLGEFCDTEASSLCSTRRIRRKRKNADTTLLSSLVKQAVESSDTKSSSTIKNTQKKKNCSILTEDLKSSERCKYNNSKYKEIEPAEKSLETLETKATKPAKKSREKYLLMCSYCSLKVEGAKKLEKHEATHNENRERTVVCPECGLKLYTDWSLNLHMKVHDTNRQKNHKCEFCEKAFFNKGALNVHRRIHLGLMIKCQICEKEFFRQIDLDKHLLKHSSSPLEKNVGKKKIVAQCQYCNKSVFTDKLKEHIAVHLDQPQVKCKICDKNFYSRAKCTNHLRRFHLKNLSEYEEFIHYYVDRNTRLSSLMIKQQLVVQPLSK